VKKEEAADDEVEEEVPFPTFGKTVAGFEALWRYNCSFAHHDNRELLLERHVQQRRNPSWIIYTKKILIA
jgi:hypothetical protein